MAVEAAREALALRRSEGDAPIGRVTNHQVKAGARRLLQRVGYAHDSRRGATCSRSHVRQQQLDRVLPEAGGIWVQLQPDQARADMP